MREAKLIKPPGSLQELEEAAKRETLSRAGKEAIIENYAKRNNMTIEEAREKLGYASVKADKIQIGKGKLVGDGNGGVTEKSVKALLTKQESNEATLKQKEPVSPIGMTDEKFARLDDDTQIVVTAGMLRRFAHMIRAEERLKYRPISLDEMLEIAEEAS